MPNSNPAALAALEQPARNSWHGPCWCFVLFAVIGTAHVPVVSAGETARIRIATFNASLNRPALGQLRRDLATQTNPQARQIAEIIQRVRPDVLLLNEFDFDETGQAVERFQRNYLQVSQAEQPPIRFRYQFTAPVNTGVPSGLDLDGDGESTGPGDAFGFGRFPGQYGMVVFSKFPLATDRIRTFRKFLWRDMPAAEFPVDPASGRPFYSTAAREAFRLSSKSVWDVPILVGSRAIHLIAAHPTPPVFDGPEDRNGLRNQDEIRFLADYIDPERSRYIYDDRRIRGGVPAGTRFVIAGDMNADPHDGDSRDDAIRQLLDHPRIQAAQKSAPASRGAIASSNDDGGVNGQHRGDPAHDTANFTNDDTVGNLRLDYLLPSQGLEVRSQGVFWPLPHEAGHAAITASDHHLVWIDLEFAAGNTKTEQ